MTHMKTDFAVSLLLKKYPFVQKNVLGETAAGRPILAYSLGTGKDHVLFLGGMSALEMQNTWMLYRFLERVASSLKHGRPLCGIRLQNSLRERKITIVPCLNPDGMAIYKHGASAAGCYRGLVERAVEKKEIPWAANARGVELSLNFPSNIPVESIDAPLGAPQGFGGQRPFSEAETAALRTLCETESFRHVVLLDGLGGYIQKPPTGVEDWQVQMPMALKILAQSANYPILESPFSAGSFAAWFGETHRRPVFSFAPQRVCEPLEKEALAAVYKELEEALLLAAIL